VPYSSDECNEFDKVNLGSSTTSRMNTMDGSVTLNGILSDGSNSGHSAIDIEEKPKMSSNRKRSTIDLLPARNPPKRTLYDLIPILYIFRPIIHIIFKNWRSVQHPGLARAKKGKKKRPIVESNVPLELW
jgi:hypothetical protein